MRGEKCGEFIRSRQRVAAVLSIFPTRERCFHRSKKCAGDMSFAINSFAFGVIRQIVAAVENHPIRVVPMRGEGVGADEHGVWNQASFTTMVCPLTSTRSLSA